MIKILITDFSRTLLFPKNFTDVHEMNSINRTLISEKLNIDPENLTEENLRSGGKYYSAWDYFVLNEPLINRYRQLKEKGISLRIFTSGFVQYHSDFEEKLSIFDDIFNVQENGGFKKTDPQAYENILNNLKVKYPEIKSEEIIFVDDESSNIDAAKKAGLSTYLFPKYSADISQEEFLEMAAKEFTDCIRI